VLSSHLTPGLLSQRAVEEVRGSRSLLLHESVGTLQVSEVTQTLGSGFSCGAPFSKHTQGRGGYATH
jgi:hypothetical protein